MLRRRYLAALTVVAFAGCQQVLGISPGTLIQGAGGTGGTTGSSTSSLGFPSSSSTGTTATTSTSSNGTTTSSSSGSSTASSTSSTASSGSGGSGSCTETLHIVDMIDDMEMNQPSILSNNGRGGPWFTYNSDAVDDHQVPDPTMNGACTPAMPGFCSNYAMRTTGACVGAGGYAGIGFAINQVNGVSAVWDASAYSGLAFMAKSKVGTQALNFIVLESDVAEQTATSGGTCVPGDAAPSQQCGDYHQHTFTITSQWAQYSVTWAMLSQGQYGQHFGPFNPKHLLGIQFAVGPTASFDFSLDDIGFY